MIRYSDYNGPQGGAVVNRDGKLVPFDRAAALELALNAQMLATGIPERPLSESDTASTHRASPAE